ncbi:hypothetical protein KIN20_009960 [Parelaphostrongylus tenuis]|uniref:Uncharacterized protein n=1 Tax=Parelaphostrongylus tenuis TaxID=148309 RepID=A0AAD5QLK1_PARTN|nr:hypothetical protein KIN20_009960 [Parelaphostrongylus tenuis]
MRKRTVASHTVTRICISKYADKVERPTMKKATITQMTSPSIEEIFEVQQSYRTSENIEV